MSAEALIRRRLLESSTLLEKASTLVPEIRAAVDLVVTAYRNGKKVVLFGNGGSASDAQHIAAELVGKFRFERPSLPALVLGSNPAALTAMANDFSYDSVFERAITGLVETGDVVIALSTSGNSPNVLNGAIAARRKGARVIGLCGLKGRLAGLCDLVLAVPSTDTPRIQEVHLTLGHILCELVEEELYGDHAKAPGRGFP